MTDADNGYLVVAASILMPIMDYISFIFWLVFFFLVFSFGVVVFLLGYNSR